MPCYVVEYLWHVVLGEPPELPWRSEDARLPLALRFEGGRETRHLQLISADVLPNRPWFRTLCVSALAGLPTYNEVLVGILPLRQF